MEGDNKDDSMGVDRPVSGWQILGFALGAVGFIGTIAYAIYVIIASPIPPLP